MKLWHKRLLYLEIEKNYGLCLVLPQSNKLCKKMLKNLDKFRRNTKSILPRTRKDVSPTVCCAAIEVRDINYAREQSCSRGGDIRSQ